MEREQGKGSERGKGRKVGATADIKPIGWGIGKVCMGLGDTRREKGKREGEGGERNEAKRRKNR